MSQEELNENLYGFNLLEILRILDRQRKLLFSVIILIITSGMTYTFYERVKKPIYKGHFSLLVEDPFKKNEENLRGENFIEDIASYKTKNDIPTIIEVLKSKPLLNKAIRENNISYKNLLRSLVITKGGNIKNIREEAEGILKISYFGKDKSDILSVLNNLSQEYISYSLKQKQDRIKEGLEFLNSQNPDIQKNITEIQLKLKNIKANSSTINPQNQLDLLNEEILRLDNEKKSLEIKLQTLINFKNEIKDTNEYISRSLEKIPFPNEKIKSNFSGLDSYFSDQAIILELDSLKNKLASSRTIFKPESEIIISFENKIKVLEPIAKESQLKAVDYAIKDINLKINQINNIIEKVISQNKKLPDLITEFETLNQDLELARENYISFTKTKEKFRLGIAQNNFPWQIINQPSVDANPIKPDIFKRLYQLLLLSFFAGTASAFLKDRIENFYHSSIEIKEKLNLDIYGTIPYLKNTENNFYSSKRDISSKEIANMSKEELLRMRQINKDLYLHRESFRYLVNNLELAKERKKFKLINITSTIQGEGKTQTCIDLAKTLNSLNKRVLLIDADMRRPKIHIRFGIKNKKGFSQITKLDESSFSSILQKIDKYKNLDLITSGPEVNDPFKIFSSNKFEEFLGWLKNNESYDYIIFDSPLALFLADTNSLSNKVEYTLLVVSLFKVEKDLVIKALSDIRLSNGNVLGVVSINSKNLQSFGYKYNYGSYRYGYEYLDGAKTYEKKLNDDKDNFFSRLLKQINEWFTRT